MTPLSHSPAERLERAKLSLEGLSVGDALGEALSYQFYRCRELTDFSQYRAGSFRYTDDTQMALALVNTLKRMNGVDEEVIAWAFSSAYRKDPDRGYGKMARRILEEIGLGTPWKTASQNAFGGGSFGNGAAMRVSPLGAYFADAPEQIPAQATHSARVTHFHPEAIAGAIAVALAAAAATESRSQGKTATEAATAIWQQSLQYTPESQVKTRLERVHDWANASAAEVAREVGHGAEISAQDTVPFCIWSATQNPQDYPEAIMTTLEIGGDCDTNCAIVGGIVSCFAGVESIPTQWRRVREEMIVS